MTTMSLSASMGGFCGDGWRRSGADLDFAAHVC
jgi:hypothetical protein